MRVIIRLRVGGIGKKLLAVCAGAILIGVAGLGYAYVQTSRRIDRLFQERPWERVPTIYSAPTPVFVGMELTQDDLVTLLHRRGYLPRPLLDEPPCFRSEPEQGALWIHDAPAGTLGAAPGPRLVRLRFTSGRLSELADFDGKSVAEAWVRPAILARQRSGGRSARLTLADLPPNLVYAVLAAEDRRFFDHPGLDFIGILRSLRRNLAEDRIAEGASTITQQLVKNLFLHPGRTWSRKIEEAFFALILEARMSKEELFSIYANMVYLGQNATFAIHGFGPAAETYCNTATRNLSLADCALLAGMIRSPNTTHPLRHPEQAIARRNQILEAMARAGFILPTEAQAAAALPLPRPATDWFHRLEAPYFLDLLGNALHTPTWQTELATNGTVHASLSPELQGAAESGLAEALTRVRASLARHHPEPAARLQAALVVLDPTSGAIRALVGGSDYATTPFNRASHARRQAGSTLKPFLYATMLDLGGADPSRDLTAATVVEDRAVAIPYDRGRVYRPRNYGGLYLGPVTMRTALSRSLNAATVRLAQRAGFPRLAVGVDRLGFASRATPYPALALGAIDVTPMELAGAYTIFANAGHRRVPVPWQPDRHPRLTPVAPAPVCSAGAAYITRDMLRDVVETGTARRVRLEGIDLAMAAKTGTARDGWFVALTDNLLACAWVGLDESVEIPLAGGESALYIVTAFLHHARRVYPIHGLTGHPPPGLTRQTVCSRSGRLAGPACPRTETSHFLPATAPATPCLLHR